ncbi:MAG: hypothetical protein JSV40_04495, partial [Deltaproteobacteria bacterium]
ALAAFDFAQAVNLSNGDPPGPLSPYVRLSSRRSLLTLGGVPPLPRISLRDNGSHWKLRKL